MLLSRSFPVRKRVHAPAGQVESGIPGKKANKGTRANNNNNSSSNNNNNNKGGGATASEVAIKPAGGGFDKEGFRAEMASLFPGWELKVGNAILEVIFSC